jgi:hypothetical protein
MNFICLNGFHLIQIHYIYTDFITINNKVHEEHNLNKVQESFNKYLDI